MQITNAYFLNRDAYVVTHFLEYHPRQCASIVRALSWILIIITLIIGLNLFSGQVHIQNEIKDHYGLVMSKTKSQIVVRNPNKPVSAHWQKNQNKGIKACSNHYMHQEKIGCLTLLIAYLWWAFASLIIEDFFRPLIPIKLYISHLKSKIKKS